MYQIIYEETEKGGHPVYRNTETRVLYIDGEEGQALEELRKLMVEEVRDTGTHRIKVLQFQKVEEVPLTPEFSAEVILMTAQLEVESEFKKKETAEHYTKLRAEGIRERKEEMMERFKR
jgi:hypothetical protein